MIKMMEDISLALQKAKEDEVIKKKQQEEDDKARIERDRDLNQKKRFVSNTIDGAFTDEARQELEKVRKLEQEKFER